MWVLGIQLQQLQVLMNAMVGVLLTDPPSCPQLIAINKQVQWA